MKTSRQRNGTFVRLISITGMLIPLLLLLTGCETPEGTAAVGHVYNANAALASNPQQAAAWGLLGAIAGSTAQMQHEKELAVATRPQIVVNNANSASTGDSPPLTSDPRILKWLVDHDAKVRSLKMNNGATYTGKVSWNAEKGLLANGNGELIYNDGAKYTGDFKEGSRHGQGTLETANGDQLEGNWTDDALASGTYLHSNGQKYVGEFKDGKRHGQGKLETATGERLEGNWKDDALVNGTCVYTNGERYVGEFKDNNPHGQGIYTWPDGKKFVGQIKNGQPHGCGTKSDSEGNSLTGEWVEGVADGTLSGVNPRGSSWTETWRNKKLIKAAGTQIWPDGTKYIGEWNEDGSKSRGTITWKDGREYKGEWKIIQDKQDLPDGEGTLTWPDGRKYLGDFKDGKLHGFGKMTYPDGKAEEGIWRDDRLVGAQVQVSQAVGGSAGSSASKLGSVSVAADDQSFEVFADGAFVGNIPAKLKLPEGAHVIEVKKAGFKDYRKEIKVTEGSELNLRAVLEKN